MKLIISLIMAMMSLTPAIFAGSFEQLGSAAGPENSAIEVTVARPAPEYSIEEHKAEVRAMADLMLQHPALFTANQLKDLMADLDAILGRIARSSPERNEFNALREAVSKELNNRTGGERLLPFVLRQMKAEVREKAEAVLKTPGSFSLGEVGGVMAALDLVRASLPESSDERKEFDGLRGAIHELFSAHP